MSVGRHSYTATPIERPILFSGQMVRAPWSSNPWVWVVEFKRQPATDGRSNA